MSPPPHPASPKRRRSPVFDLSAARATWTAALTLLLLVLVYAIRGTIFIFAVSLLFAYLLYPLVNQISERLPPKNRTPGLALTYLLVLGVLAALAIGIGSQVAAEARQLVAEPPDVRGFVQHLAVAHPALSPIIVSAEGRIRQQLGDIVSGAPRLSLHVLAASANLIYLIVIPILSFFMLKDGTRIRDSLITMFPAGSGRAAAKRTMAAVHSLLLSYMRSQLLLCCTVLVVFSIALSALGVRYALLLSSIAFFGEFVPLVGPISAAAVTVAVSALSGYPHLWWLLCFLGAFRVLQDYVLSPRLMGKGVKLHPLLVIFGVFAGAEIAGVAGIFLSIPVLALARLILVIVFQRADPE